MKVKDAMHKGVDWVSPETPVTELAKLMREHDIGAIPIGENDRLIGMVTDRDIVCKGLAREDFDPSRATFMINYNVDDLDALLDRLKEEGVKIDAKRMNESYGRFAWIYDLDGNKIELWQPSAKP